MATILLIVIYIAFIGLGIPDSIFESAWSAIYSEFGLPISFASFVSVIIACRTTASSILSSRIISLLGTSKVSLVSTALTAIALLGFSYSGNLVFMCLFALPLGLGAGAIDAAMNNYVALYYSAKHMSFLHCFYGIGVSLSPYVLSLVIDGQYGWRGGYRIVFGIQIFITLILIISLPIWKKAHGGRTDAEERTTEVLAIKEIIRIPGVRPMICLFIASCAIEFTCGGWGSTFLVEYKNMDAGQAARMIMFYYMGMALGRFLLGILAAWLNGWQIIKMGQCVLGMALIILILPVSLKAAAAGLFMVGLGNGPLVPNLNYLTPQNFGEDISQSVMGTQMAAAYVGIMLAPMLCGFLSQIAGMGIFPVYLLGFYVVMMIATRKVKRIILKDSDNY